MLQSAQAQGETHNPHFGLVDGAAAKHDELMRAFRAEVGPLT
jgi:hypothetical protein